MTKEMKQPTNKELIAILNWDSLDIPDGWHILRGENEVPLKTDFCAHYEQYRYFSVKIENGQIISLVGSTRRRQAELLEVDTNSRRYQIGQRDVKRLTRIALALGYSSFEQWIRTMCWSTELFRAERTKAYLIWEEDQQRLEEYLQQLTQVFDI